MTLVSKFFVKEVIEMIRNKNLSEKLAKIALLITAGVFFLCLGVVLYSWFLN